MTWNILIVDDSEPDQFAHLRVLRETGYVITTAQTIATAVAMATKNLMDVVLLDYNLPDGNGLDFIRLMNERKSEDMPCIIMLTGSGNEAIAVAAMKAGACDYLIKDVAGGYLKLLPTLVKRVLRERNNLMAKREADRELQLAATVYHNITEGILITDQDGVIVSVNPAFCAITGYLAEQLIGNNPRIIKSHRHDNDFYQTMWANIVQDGCWQGEVWNRHKNGRLFLVRETITAIRNNQGLLQNYVAVLVDITEEKQTAEFVRYQAYHDPLTGLPNRSLFMDRLRHQLAYANRQKTGLAVLFIDLDGFKAVNDELGHAMGDVLLKEVAVRLKGCIRESDTVARLGGDEFTAILANLSDTDDVIKVAKKILDQLAYPIQLVAELEGQVSASIGIALYPSCGNDAAVLLKTADEAMYQVKRDGRNGYMFATETDTGCD
jgi:diguanylate cyclase (GGDEF)-like protein/PAS domain S-box-containing protein